VDGTIRKGLFRHLLTLVVPRISNRSDNRGTIDGEFFATGGTEAVEGLSCNTVVHPAVLPDQMNAEIHRFGALLARCFLGLSVAPPWPRAH
jgi:hypothetical protein